MRVNLTKYRRRTLVITLTLVVTLAVSACRPPESSEPTLAPSLTVVVLHEGSERVTVEFPAHFSGRAVALVFAPLEPTAASATMEMQLRPLAPTWRTRGLDVMLVLPVSAAVVETMFPPPHYVLKNWSVIADPDQKMARVCGVRMAPTTVFMNQAGEIVKTLEDWSQTVFEEFGSWAQKLCPSDG